MPKKSKKLNLITAALVFLAAGLSLLVIIWMWLVSPVDSGSSQARSFVIPKGQAISIIGQRLEEEGLIRDQLVFRMIVKLYGLDNKIQAGSFKLMPSDSTLQISNQLTQGTEDLWITILEGWRVEEVAEMLDRQDLDEFNKKQFIQIASFSEGYLYPDTYLVPQEMTTQAIFELLTDTFDKKVSQGLEDEIADSQYDLEDVMVMASIVEREAREFEQMRVVAGILWNRIEIGMSLQADATLQYATGYNAATDDWWTPPTSEDKKTNSPFNTYLRPGLPPRPISNPSLNAIKASLNPDDNNYLYYIHDRQGRIHYAKTLEEHTANIRQYLR